MVFENIWTAFPFISSWEWKISRNLRKLWFISKKPLIELQTRFKNTFFKNSGCIYFGQVYKMILIVKYFLLGISSFCNQCLKDCFLSFSQGKAWSSVKEILLMWYYFSRHQFSHFHMIIRSCHWSEDFIGKCCFWIV